MELSVKQNTGIRKSKSKVFCCVYGCSSKASQPSGLSFHLFPQAGYSTVKLLNKFGQPESVDTRKAWEYKLRMSKPASKFMRVCSLHFTASDYFPGAGKKHKIAYGKRLHNEYVYRKKETKVLTKECYTVGKFTEKLAMLEIEGKKQESKEAGELSRPPTSGGFLL